LPVLVASGAVIPLVVVNGTIDDWEALILIWFAVTYTMLMIHATRGRAIVASAKADASAAWAVADAAGAPSPVGKPRALVTALMGLLVVLVGGDIFIEGAISAAQALGISDRLVGITIVAVGTSLPELVTCAIAARRGHSSLAVGNVVGSNIFNSFLCLGVAGMSGVISAPLSSLAIWLLFY
jgi:cation:H+ antiporter